MAQKWIKNKTEEPKTYRGLEFPAGAYTEITANQIPSFQSDVSVIADLVAGDIAMSATGNTEYPGNASAQIDFLKSIEVGAKEVITQLEKDDKTLGLVSIEGVFSGNECILSIQIPGTPGGIGRYVKEGYAFSDSYTFGMRLLKASVVDKNFIYAGGLYPATPFEAGIPGTEGMSWADIMPNGVELGDYCDTEVPAENKGWRMWAEEGGQGGCDIDNLAGYGELPAGAYMEMTFSKPEGGSATKIAADIQWGIQK